jgi:hypothetical protein
VELKNLRFSPAQLWNRFRQPNQGRRQQQYLDDHAVRGGINCIGVEVAGAGYGSC